VAIRAKRVSETDWDACLKCEVKLCNKCYIEPVEILAKMLAKIVLEFGVNL